MYQPHCGLQNVLITWGHDEYLVSDSAITATLSVVHVIFTLLQYMVCKKQSSLPQAALNMIRYHSFYPWHREGAYQHLMNEDDKQALKDVLAFNPYDLYSKSDARPNPVELRPYYEGLIKKFFPEKINW